MHLKGSLAIFYNGILFSIGEASLRCLSFLLFWVKADSDRSKIKVNANVNNFFNVGFFSLISLTFLWSFSLVLWSFSLLRSISTDVNGPLQYKLPAEKKRQNIRTRYHVTWIIWRKYTHTSYHVVWIISQLITTCEGLSELVTTATTGLSVKPRVNRM